MPVTSLEIHKREPYAQEQSFGSTGTYEQISATAFFKVNPDHPDNRLIADIELTKTDSNGLVSFSADVCILQPVDPAKRNNTLYIDIPNRGRDRSLNLLNSSDTDQINNPGNGFLMRQGYTLAWCGWQHDIPSSQQLMKLHTPTAEISGQIAINIQTNQMTYVEELSERGHEPYPAMDTSDHKAVLTVRDHEEAEPSLIPRDEWQFANTDGINIKPDKFHIHLNQGFHPGKIYQIIYTTDKAPISGLGLLATRDFVSFLRYSDSSPCQNYLSKAIGFGQSQSGRFLRTLLYLGLNSDEDDRIIFDGIIAHVAGARRGEFNQRFSQPSTAVKHSKSNLFPFTDTAAVHPTTNIPDSLLQRQTLKGNVPKIFLMNSACEYWWAHASLTHTDVTANIDIEPSNNVRIYSYSGAQHASGTFPATDYTPNGVRGEQLFNWVDYRPALRASLLNLHKWIESGVEPPPNQIGRISDKTLLLLESIRPILEKIPGVHFPKYLKRISYMVFDKETQKAENLPSEVGEPYEVRVPSIDNDGNEIPGIRLPDISVPIGTHTGWNIRHEETGGPGQVIGTTGSTIPFSSTKVERETNRDPRRSLEERYSSIEDYLSQVKDNCEQLVKDRFLITEDIASIINDSRERFNILVKST
jgi:hypothetical protein